MKHTLKHYRKYIPFVFLVMIFLFGQAMCELALPGYMSDIINNGIVKGDLAHVKDMGFIMIIVSAGSMACAISGNFFAAFSAAKICRNIRSALFGKVAEFSAAEMSRFSTASLITRSTNDIQTIQQTTTMLMRMALFAPIMGIGAVYKALNTSVPLSWTIAVALGVIICVMLIAFFTVLPKFKVLQSKLDRLNLIMKERLEGMLVIRAFTTERQEERRFDAANVELRDINIFINRAMSFLMPALMFVMNAVSILIVWAGAHLIEADKLMIGDMLAYLQYAMHVIMSFLFVTAMFIMLPRAMVSAQRVGEVLGTECSINDPKMPAHFDTGVGSLIAPSENGAPAENDAPDASGVPAENGAPDMNGASSENGVTDMNGASSENGAPDMNGASSENGATDMSDAPSDDPLPGRVDFRGVAFAYPGAEKETLSGIDFTAEPGKTTAIIGGTGSGKSTLVQLIPRFYDATAGQVMVDGIDVRDVAQHELRSRIGYVPQKGNLFSGTIADNLRYGRDDATEEEMNEAVRVAQATEFIAEKDEGLQELISQGGTNVSGGQKQRLAIARALIRKPDIYIFDDSFSALDFATDRALRSELKKYAAGSTIIIVAQRINTIMNADQILVLDEGRIVGKGNHSQLMKECSVYQEIARSQLSEEELERGWQA